MTTNHTAAFADPGATELEEAVVAKICAPIPDGEESGMPIVVDAGLKPEHFTNPALATLFRELVRRDESGAEFDPISAIFAAEGSGHLDPENRAYLLEVTGRETMRAGLAENCRTLAEQAAKRKADALARRAQLYLRDGNREEAMNLLQLATEDEAPKPRKAPREPDESLWDGRIELPAPTIGEYAPGRFLFYQGEVNSIFAPPEAGKSWIAVVTSKQLLDAGWSILHLDPESTEGKIVIRFKVVGADGRGRVFYDNEITAERIAAWHRWASRQKKKLFVTIDGLANFICGTGGEENSGDSLKILNEIAKPFRDAGATVLVIDHAGKDTTKGARGHSSKLGFYKGAVYEAKVLKAFTPKTSGRLQLILRKDNDGNAGRRGKPVADLEAAVTERGTDFRLHPAEDEPEDEPKPGRRQKVSDAEILEALPTGWDNARKYGMLGFTEIGVDGLAKRCADLPGANVKTKSNENGRKERFFWKDEE